MTIFGQPFFIICSRWVRVRLLGLPSDGRDNNHLKIFLRDWVVKTKIREHFALSWRLNSSLQVVSKATTSWGCFSVIKSETIVPLYALGQNSKNEKYMQTSIANWNLHRLRKSFNRRLQEAMALKTLIHTAYCQFFLWSIVYPGSPVRCSSTRLWFSQKFSDVFQG
jgi:hypothetical protein